MKAVATAVTDASGQPVLAELTNWERRKKKIVLGSLYQFCERILGYDRLSPEVHGPLCAFLEDENCKRKLILMPRYTFKSSIVSIAYPLWRLARNTNDHVLLDSKVVTLARRNLYALKRIMQSEKFVKYFGYWRSKDRYGKRWGRETVDIAPRDDDSRGDPSLQAFGLDQSNVGFHFKRIVCDDLHDEKNTRSEDQIDWVKHHMSLLESIVDPDGEIVIIGTRWADSDLYGAIIDSTTRGSGDYADFKVFIRRAYNEDGSLLLPDVLSKEKLEALQRTQSAAVFSAQYLNDPLAGGRQMFTAPYYFFNGEYEHSALHVTEMITLNGDRMESDSHFQPVSIRRPNLYMSVDPAGSEEKGADQTAIVIACTTPDGRLWVLDCEGGRWSPSQVVAAIFRLSKRWKPLFVAVEKAGLSAYLMKTLRDEENRENHILNVRPAEHKSRAKDIRIRALEPRHRAGNLILHESLRNKPLFTQLQRFPVCRHEDYLDALAYLEDLMFVPEDFEDDIEEQPPVEHYAMGMQVASI